MLAVPVGSTLRSTFCSLRPSHSRVQLELWPSRVVQSLMPLSAVFISVATMVDQSHNYVLPPCYVRQRNCCFRSFATTDYAIHVHNATLEPYIS